MAQGTRRIVFLFAGHRFETPTSHEPPHLSLARCHGRRCRELPIGHPRERDLVDGGPKREGRSLHLHLAGRWHVADRHVRREETRQLEDPNRRHGLRYRRHGRPGCTLYRGGEPVSTAGGKNHRGPNGSSRHRRTWPGYELRSHRPAGQRQHHLSIVRLDHCPRARGRI